MDREADATGQAKGENPPENRMALLKAEGLLLALYSFWSEEFYAAGFMNPTPGTVGQFRRWLKDTLETAPPQEDYEREFLEEFRRQELAE